MLLIFPDLSYANLKRKVNNYLNIKQMSKKLSRKMEVSKNYPIINEFKVMRIGINR